MNNLSNISAITDYSEVLKTYGLEYTPSGLYWQVGKISKTQGWIVHLSVIEIQLLELLSLVIPELVDEEISFKIVMEKNTAVFMMAGSYGYDQIGKMVSIYPEEDALANRFAKRLIKLTSTFRGPAIPTDRHLGSIVYTRYGSFNPVMVPNATGQPVKCIYNHEGQLIPDPYTIPFALPKGITWPFQDITSPTPPKSPKLLNGVYYPLFDIKPDSKGNVMKAIYFKKFWQIKSCIIKQGHPNMLVDNAGRDMKDRLKWQFELYRALKNDIPLPEVYDYFISNEDAYLAMEFIKGISLTQWIEEQCDNRSWVSLDRPKRLLLLDKLLTIVDIIRRLHGKGFIHRDITSDNFLIDGRGNLFLIDMELAWSAVDRYPNPPFVWGTPGHMSPEQMATEAPTVKQDIYGLGGLMVLFFTNLRALQFHQQSAPQLRETLRFCTGEPLLADMVAGCWEVSPDDRPDLAAIYNTLAEYSTVQRNENRSTPRPTAHYKSRKKITDIINAGLAGLALPQFLNHRGRWVSRVHKTEDRIGNEQMDMTLSEGWHTGMAGPLWLVARAKSADWNIDSCLTPYRQSWDYLEKNYLPTVASNPPGLYFGAAGIALAIVEGLNSGLLAPDSCTLQQLRNCFSQKARGLSLASGVAGQGMAVLRSGHWLKAEDRQSLLKSYLGDLLESQLLDGSWITEYNMGTKKEKITGMEFGIAGIIWFLLSCLEVHPEKSLEHSAVKALDWMAGKMNKKSHNWPISSNSSVVDNWTLSHGSPGIVLVFIKAYEVFKNSLYAEIAQRSLLKVNPYPSRMDFSLATGLPGLGEIYLEAVKVFETQEWSQRCDWVANLLANSYSKFDGSTCYWTSGLNTSTTADLFTANSGILHFLIRHANAASFGHPLSG